MELVQPGGDRNFSGGLATIARVVKELEIPVIVKETGCGISASVAKRLKNVPVSCMSMSRAPAARRGSASKRNAPKRRTMRLRKRSATHFGIGEFPPRPAWGWWRAVGFETIFATGGIKSGMDVARAIALGAQRRRNRASHAAGGARARRKRRAHALVDAIEAELRAAMLLDRQSKCFTRFGTPQKVIVGELGLWLPQTE